MSVHLTKIFAFGALFTFFATVSAEAAGPYAVDDGLQIELFPGFDQFGNQLSVVQTWNDGTGARTAFSIYDTGASVVTLSANDQALFELITPGQAVPIKKANGASATAIGGSGTLTGDVSKPGALRTAGLSAFSFDLLNPLNFGVDPTAGIEVPGIQMFVGTSSGSSVLPTITGTPIHIPTTSKAGHENGSAALIDMRSYQLDLEALLGDPLFKDIFLPLPDVEFVPRGHTLAGKSDTYQPVTIPVTLFGADNTADPGYFTSESYNPVVENVRTSRGANIDENRTFLFDTGAQLSVISTEMALQLGLDLNSPQSEIDVQGASGNATIPGFTIDTLRLPRDVPGTYLEFTNVPVFVLDIGSGIDGILGMNLFNGADEILYDPFRPSELGGPLVSVTFLEGRTTIDDEILAGIFPTFSDTYSQSIQEFTDLYMTLLVEFGGLDPGELDDALLEINALLAPLGNWHGSRFAVNGVASLGAQVVPEPNSAILASLGLAMLASWRRRGLRRRVG